MLTLGNGTFANMWQLFSENVKPGNLVVTRMQKNNHNFVTISPTGFQFRLFYDAGADEVVHKVPKVVHTAPLLL